MPWGMQALRGVAFATALIGEATLLMGDLSTAEPELTEAAELHHDIDAPSGEAHCLQRLAEVHLAPGDRDGAQEFLDRRSPGPLVPGEQAPHPDGSTAR